MQMQSVETSAGTAICAAPSRMPVCRSLPWSRLRSMFSIATVASSTRMPTASARPPSVMMLMVSPSALSMQMEAQDRKRNRDGDDQRAAPAPQKQQNHDGGEARGDDGFANHAADGGAHEQRLIGDRLDLQRGRKRGRDLRQQGLAPA